MECSVQFCEFKIETNNDLYGFPRKNKDRINRWKRLCGLDLDDTTNNKRVCKNHFKSTNFEQHPVLHPKLKSDAEPDINLPNSEVIK